MTEEGEDASSSPNQSAEHAMEQKSSNEDKDESKDNTENGIKPASKSKDPNRPKRKKARRACFACQRAHLTCGDERPCQRCVKRGLQDQCQDGMRKKAKYLHDAPNEALMPGIVDPYYQANGNKSSTKAPSMNVPQPATTMQQPQFITQPPPQAFQPYPPQDVTQAQMPPPMQDASSFSPYTTQQPSMSVQLNPQQPSPMSSMAGAFQPGSVTPANAQPYGTAPIFDPNDPSMYNFDLSGMNFGNHYGALEFGMLSHMSMGTNDVGMLPPQRPQSSSTSFDTSTMSQGGFSESPNNYPFHRDSADWQHKTQASPGTGMQMYPTNNLFQGAQQPPHAYAIGTNPMGSISATSPSSSVGQNFDSSLDAMTNLSQPQRRHHQQQQQQQQQSTPVGPQDQPEPKTPPFRSVEHSDYISKEMQQLPSAPKRARRNPSAIYKKVTKPYPYTAAFHALTAVLQRRFSSFKRLRIARAMASIRPSLISLQRTLIDRDLVLMETCFQRQLFEIEDIASACGTPTLAIRRTGEVAYVGKEFTLLTGWTKDVLLGRAPNLNVNMRDSASGPVSGQTTRGQTTPTMRAPQGDGQQQQQHQQSQPTQDQKDQQQQYLSSSTSPSSRPQPVFLVELLDDDSAIQWFEDFARLAFADSKGIASSPCKLLKYKTEADQVAEPLPADDHKNNIIRHHSAPERPKELSSSEADQQTSLADDTVKREPKSHSIPRPEYLERKRSANNQPLMGMEKMAKLGSREGKINCMYCWQVKRDVFDVPMMIVINFLPIV